MMKRYIFLLAATLLGGAAAAQDHTPPVAPTAQVTASTARQGAMQMCRADIESLCPGVRLGDGKIRQCIRTNFAKLSPDCRDAVKALRGQRQRK